MKTRLRDLAPYWVGIASRVACLGIIENLWKQDGKGLCQTFIVWRCVAGVRSASQKLGATCAWIGRSDGLEVRGMGSAVASR